MKSEVEAVIDRPRADDIRPYEAFEGAISLQEQTPPSEYSLGGRLSVSELIRQF